MRRAPSKALASAATFGTVLARIGGDPWCAALVSLVAGSILSQQYQDPFRWSLLSHGMRGSRRAPMTSECLSFPISMGGRSSCDSAARPNQQSKDLTGNNSCSLAGRTSRIHEAAAGSRLLSGTKNGRYGQGRDYNVIPITLGHPRRQMLRRRSQGRGANRIVRFCIAEGRDYLLRDHWLRCGEKGSQVGRV